MKSFKALIGCIARSIELESSNYTHAVYALFYTLLSEKNVLATELKVYSKLRLA